MINLIWAMTKDGYIGNNNQLPWNIKDEMKYFRQLTLTKTVLMGSKTFVSMGQPLKNRNNIIITNNIQKYQNIANEYCIISNDLPSILKQYSRNHNNELWVIGGANIFQQAFKQADYLYVSIIKATYPGDLKFPINNFNDFKIIKTADYPEFTAYIYKREAY